MSETKRFQRDGCTLACDVEGEGPPVLLVHGVAVHGPGWRPQIDVLAPNFRCITLDNRGMGRSQPAGRHLSVEQMADDALAALDAVGVESAHVVGHSLGGLIAMELALRAPGRVRSMALLCTGARGSDLVRVSWWSISVGLRNRIGTRRQRRRAFLDIVLSPTAAADANADRLAESLAPIFGYDLANQPLIALRQASATRVFDITDRIRQLPRRPTLVLSGAHDRIAPPELGRALARAIPGSRYLELEDGAHGVTIECAERVNAILGDHLSGAESTWGRSLVEQEWSQ